MHPLNATPHAVSAPPVWLLGSSDYSARLAAERGLPYVFAHHFSGQGTAAALALYRSQLPALRGARRAAHLPHRQRGRSPRPRRRPTGSRSRSSRRWWRCAPAASCGAQRLVEEAEKDPVADAHVACSRRCAAAGCIGTPDSAAAEITRAGLVVRRGRGDGPPGRRRLHRHPTRHLPRPRDHPPPPRRRPRLTPTDPDSPRRFGRPGAGELTTGTSRTIRNRARRRAGPVAAERADVAGELDPLLAVPVGDQPVDRDARGCGRARPAGHAGLDGGQPQDAAADRVGQLLQRGDGQADLLRVPCQRRLQRRGRHRVEVLRVRPQQVGRAGERGRHPGSELLPRAAAAPSCAPAPG